MNRNKVQYATTCCARNILGIYAASDYLSVAIHNQQGQCCSYQQKVDDHHSDHILPEIGKLLTLANINVQQLDIIAYVAGPGSFTGLRIGLSVALGLSIASTAKLMAIPSFAIMAVAAKYDGKIMVGLDARLHEIYLAGIDSQSLEYFLEPHIIKPDQLREDIVACKYVGSGFNFYYKQLPEAISENLLKINDSEIIALHMLEIVLRNKYPLIAAQDAELFYLRNQVTHGVITHGI